MTIYHVYTNFCRPLPLRPKGLPPCSVQLLLCILPSLAYVPLRSYGKETHMYHYLVWMCAKPLTRTANPESFAQELTKHHVAVGV